MNPLSLIIPLVAVLVASAEINPTRPCSEFPSSMIEFSGDFQQPQPPLVKREFKTSFIQHKWNENLSHIQTGYIYFSPSQGLVRADEAYEGGLATSIFDYNNVTEEGLVDNKLTSFDNGPTHPSVWRGYVQSNYPLFSEDILVKGDAVFGGLVRRDHVIGQVASWNIIYASLPVTLYVDSCGVLVGYDYFSPGLRTRVITEFFNTIVGPVKV